MSACIYVFVCSASFLPLLFITLVIIWHQFICDCIYFFFFCLWTFYWDLDPYWICMCICLLPSVLSGFVCHSVYFVQWTVFWLCSSLTKCLHTVSGLSLQLPSSSLLLFAFSIFFIFALWWCMLCCFIVIYFTCPPPPPPHPTPTPLFKLLRHF